MANSESLEAALDLLRDKGFTLVGGFIQIQDQVFPVYWELGLRGTYNNQMYSRRRSAGVAGLEWMAGTPSIVGWAFMEMAREIIRDVVPRQHSLFEEGASHDTGRADRELDESR